MKLRIFVSIAVVAGFVFPDGKELQDAFRTERTVVARPDRLFHPEEEILAKLAILDQFRYNGSAPTKRTYKLNGSNLTQVLSPGKTIEFYIGTSEGENLMQELITSLQIAGGFIENAIQFSSSIKVHVSHGLYCGLPGFCETESKDINDKPYNFPAALYHQTHDRMFEYDMYMYVTVNDRMLFPVDYGSKNLWKIDVLDVLVHEMLHGFGFVSGLTYVKDEYYLDTYNVSGNLTLYDSFLYSNDMAFSNQSHWVDGKFNITGPVSFKAESTSQSIFTLSTSFYADFGHVGNQYQKEDALMLLFETQHSEFDWKLKITDWNTAPLGKSTLKVMEIFGYTLNPNPSRNHSQLALYEQMVEAGENFL